MSDFLLIQYDLKQTSHALGVSTDIILEIIEEGIVEPEGNVPGNWQFNDEMLHVLKKAMRLHQDLDIEWSGIALALDLINELEKLRAENSYLKRQLARFLVD